MLGDAVDARLFIAAATKPGKYRRILAARGDAAGHGFFGVFGRVFAGSACEVDDGHERARDRGSAAFSTGGDCGDGCCHHRSRSSCGCISAGTAAATTDAPLGHVFGVKHAITATAAAIVSTQDFLGVVHARVVDTAVGTARTARSGTDGGGWSLNENLLEFGHVLLEPRDKLLQIVIVVHL
jgi:hypothetical protein